MEALVRTITCSIHGWFCTFSIDCRNTFFDGGGHTIIVGIVISIVLVDTCSDHFQTGFPYIINVCFVLEIQRICLDLIFI